eukprot:33895_1
MGGCASRRLSFNCSKLRAPGAHVRVLSSRLTITWRSCGHHEQVRGAGSGRRGSVWCCVAVSQGHRGDCCHKKIQGERGRDRSQDHPPRGQDLAHVEARYCAPRGFPPKGQALPCVVRGKELANFRAAAIRAAARTRAKVYLSAVPRDQLVPRTRRRARHQTGEPADQSGPLAKTMRLRVRPHSDGKKPWRSYRLCRHALVSSSRALAWRYRLREKCGCVGNWLYHGRAHGRAAAFPRRERNPAVCYPKGHGSPYARADRNVSAEPPFPRAQVPRYVPAGDVRET